MLLSLPWSCQQQRTSRTSAEPIGRGNQEAKADDALLSQIPALDPTDLMVLGLELEEVRRSSNSYPQLRFQRGPFSDFAHYAICDAAGLCDEGQTGQEVATGTRIMVGRVTARVRACVNRGRSVIPGKFCGPWIQRSMVITQDRIDPEEQRRSREREALESKLAEAGGRVHQALDEFERAFTACLKADPNTKPYLSRKAILNLRAIDPQLLGEAFVVLANRSPSTKTSGADEAPPWYDEWKKAQEKSGFSSTILMGAVGVTAGSAAIVGGVATGSNKPGLRAASISLGAATVVAGALLIGSELALAADPCKANRDLANVLASIGQEVSWVNAQLSTL